MDNIISAKSIIFQQQTFLSLFLLRIFKYYYLKHFFWLCFSLGKRKHILYMENILQREKNPPQAE